MLAGPCWIGQGQGLKPDKDKLGKISVFSSPQKSLNQTKPLPKGRNKQD